MGGRGEAPPEGAGARSPCRVEGRALPSRQRLRHVEGVANSRGKPLGDRSKKRASVGNDGCSFAYVDVTVCFLHTALNPSLGGRFRASKAAESRRGKNSGFFPRTPSHTKRVGYAAADMGVSGCEGLPELRLRGSNPPQSRRSPPILLERQPPRLVCIKVVRGQSGISIMPAEIYSSTLAQLARSTR